MNNLSLIIPVYNEEECVENTYTTIKSALGQNCCPNHLLHEIIFINDGSRDKTSEILDKIAAKDDRVKVIHFARNYGQTAAMMAGIDYASGDVIVAMDSDGQNDPNDIPLLLQKIDEGYDVVSGWCRDRQDRMLSRKIPSQIANWVISKVSNVKLRDYGCSLKAYKKSIIKNIRLYGEMHRFIPIYAQWYGAKVVEIPVNHLPRKTGQSKYGINRTLKVILDLIVVKFLHQYLAKPIYIIGGFGFFCFTLGMVIFSYATYLKLFENVSYIQTPLLLLSVMTVILGVLAILVGILSEILIRTYYESQKKTPYHIKSITDYEIKDEK
jgi:glycosyltransferase involved in cell wall biosynthesis